MDDNNSFLFGSRLADDDINKQSNKIISPIKFNNPGQKYSPIVKISDQINGDQRFAITSSTEGGKYVRGGLLFYSLNGVEIYAPINSIIMVDLVNKTLFIREAEKVSAGISPENPETKQYIILFTEIGYEDSESELPFVWEAVEGRTKAYETIKSKAGVIDPDKSIVLVETVAVKDSLTVREFVKHLQNAELVDNNDDFDIDIYSSNSDYI